MGKIALNDDVKTALFKLSEGNPGAINVMMQLLSNTEKVDPDALMGPLAHILTLDSFEIYGCKIWILYKDVCGEDIINTIAVIRAVQLGLLKKHVLIRTLDVIDSVDRRETMSIDVPKLLAAVKERLPNFAKDIG